LRYLPDLFTPARKLEDKHEEIGKCCSNNSLAYDAINRALFQQAFNLDKKVKCLVREVK